MKQLTLIMMLMVAVVTAGAFLGPGASAPHAEGSYQLVLLTASALAAEEQDSLAHLRPEHRAVLQAWLARQPTLRLAVERDCVNTDGLAATRQERDRTTTLITPSETSMATAVKISLSL